MARNTVNIAIDARMYGKGFGLGRYVESLVHGLSKNPSEFSYTVYLKPEAVSVYKNQGGTAHVIEAPYHWYGWEEQTKFLRLLNQGRHDLIHFPHWNVPIGYRRPCVVTIHDLIMFHFPRYEATTRSRPVFWVKDKVHRQVVKHAVRHARAIIATSEFTKQDIIQTLQISPEKISVVYQAAYKYEGTSKSWESVANKYHLTGPYVLYVGAAYPHKNLERLVTAWSRIGHKFPDHELVLVGTKNIWYEQLEAYVQDKQINRVRILGFVEDSELAECYQHASALVFPSMYEGFGLPALEAMRAGVPVVASNAGSLPEIVGEAGYYFDPASVDHMAQGLEEVIAKPDIRHELKIKGREHVRMFSEDSFINQTLSVYHKALES